MAFDRPFNRYEMMYWWKGENVWKDRPFTRPVSKNYKVSICTTCMDRLEDLSQTIQFNIEHEPYPNIEFILLDYNSRFQPVGDWVKSTLSEHIANGKLSYYRTSEPEFYSMSHSRNIAFQLASGDIVLNVDADNYLYPIDKPPPAISFGNFINMIANEAVERAAFIKGQPLRGRLGFFKQEFLALGGYDEEIQNYGYEDVDLLKRGWRLGFTAYTFGGRYCGRIPTPPNKKGENMPDKNWRKTEVENFKQSVVKIEAGSYVRNVGKVWGAAHLVKNFSEETTSGILQTTDAYSAPHTFTPIPKVFL